MSFRSLSAVNRRLVSAFGLAALLIPVSGLRAFSQTPAPPAAGQTGAAPAAPQAAQPLLPMASDAGLILFTVKAEGAADFEMFMGKVKDALAKSTKPEHKQMAAGWKLYKGLEGAEPGKVLYVSVVDPSVKGMDYDPLKIIRDTMPAAEAKPLIDKMIAAVEGVNKLNLQGLLKMAGGN